jgi:eukaryotic-like serine/threonine-protein kinase
MSLRIENNLEPIPGYRLIERIGGGGFGEVWKAEAPGGLQKAIKIIHGDLRSDEEDGGRLAAQELRALKRIQSIRHPYLLSLERYDIIDGRLMIVMELADCNLWDRFRECRSQGLPGIPRNELIRYLEESAEVLDMMFSQHALQHLDIKPQNLFLIYNHIKVADFGLVKDLEGVRAEVTGGVTPVYAAPETFDGIVTRFCDQYSLAIVYQELLTGVRPFNGTTAQQLLMQHLQGTPNLAPLPLAERPVIARALAKKPEDRFPTCLQFVQALHQVGSDPIGSNLPTTNFPSTASRTETPGGDLRTSMHSLGSVPFPSAVPPPETPRTEFRLRQDAGSSLHSVAVEAIPQRIAPPAITGDGILFPAIVIGLGNGGLQVLRRFRGQVFDRFGSIEKVATLRTIYIDTNLESTTQANSNECRPAFHANEIIPTRLNRPTHYLKPRRNGRSLIEGWFDPQMLYRIPRNPETMGIRALGRLALLDHYRAISTKLREDLDAVTHPDNLAMSDRTTTLGLRSNRPRVYVVASLCGGTGSGMFLDMAYAIRHKLRQFGYSDPDVVGVLMVPNADRYQEKFANLLSNSFGALRELYHFSLPETVFSASYDEKDGLVNDAGAPFTRTIIVPMIPQPNMSGTSSIGMTIATRQISDFLNWEIFTPVGQSMEEFRQKSSLRAKSHITTATFGDASFTWPRNTILAETTRWLAETLLSRWIETNPGHVREHVKGWIQERWLSEECGPEGIITYLQKAVEKDLGQSPETLFNNEAQPFVAKGWFSRDPDPTKLWQTLGKLQQIVGMPDERAIQRQAGKLENSLAQFGEVFSREIANKICRFPRTLLEHPDYRIVGAEECVTQLQTYLQQYQQQYDSLGSDLGAKANDAFYQIQNYLNGESSRRRLSNSELVDCLKLYPKWRYQSLLLRQVARVYSIVKIQLSELLREIQYCRQRLEELASRFRERPPENPLDTTNQLLPAGCSSIEEAIRNLRKSITPEDLRTVDQQLQSFIEAEFQALFSVCLTSVNMIGNLQQTIEQQSRNFLQSRISKPNIEEMFLNKYGSKDGADRAMKTALDEASPMLVRAGTTDTSEICLIGIPELDKSEWLKNLIPHSKEQKEIHVVNHPDELLIYREYPYVPLVDLPQLGPISQGAYETALETPSCPPHTRSDIAQWSDFD